MKFLKEPAYVLGKNLRDWDWCPTAKSWRWLLSNTAVERKARENNIEVNFKKRGWDEQHVKRILRTT